MDEASLEIESGLLEILISSKKHLALAVREGVKPDWFRGRLNAVIYEELVKRFYERGLEMSPLLLQQISQAESLNLSEPDRKHVERIIKRALDASATTHEASLDATSSLIFSLRDASQKRALQRLVKQLSDSVAAGSSFSQICSGMESFLLANSASRTSGGLRSMGDLSREFMTFLTEERPVAQGVTTGIRSLDIMVDGLQAGQVYVLAARPAMGKTALALQIARRAAQVAPTLLCSLEMTSQELFQRMISAESRIDSHYLRSGAMTSRFVDLASDAAQRLGKLSLFVDDSPKQDFSSIRNSIRAVESDAGNVAVLIIDYLQLVTPFTSSVPREQQIAALSRAFKCLAKEKHMCVLLLCQLNRAAEKENRAPRLSDLRESGAVEQDADIVMFLDLQSEDRKSPQISAEGCAGRMLLVSKNRHGEVGGVPLAFVLPIQRFCDLAYEQESLVLTDELPDDASAQIDLPPYDDEVAPVQAELGAPSAGDIDTGRDDGAFYE